MPSEEIRYLKREEIDIDRWNGCIDNAGNGLLYAYSFYLDAMCDNWDALVLNDYQAVMPLPWRKKFFIRYVYAPPFVQQLGLIGKTTQIDYHKLMKLVTNKFSYGDILFNAGNFIPQAFPIIKRTNYVLPLDQPYNQLASKFSADLKKNVTLSQKTKMEIVSGTDIEFTIKLFQNQYREKLTVITPPHFERLLNACRELQKRNLIFTRIIAGSENEVYAAGLFLKDKKRIYNILNSTTNAGRKTSANHYLLCSVLKEFSESDLLFDFEGSDLPGVKEFYLNFRPQYQPFFHHHFNTLPFPFRLLKK